MSDAKLTSYDEVPYESYPFAQTHPDRLATVATLLGLKPIPVHRCRVLELGCAGGGNLLPMAQTLPDSTFVGIDLSGRQIADGQRMVQTLGLKNIELRHLSILDVNADFGRFDYIICHGVYSWVPARVQDKILEICAQNLTANGLAYVSYNTYPGWHMRGMIRDMMCYHAQHFHGPQLRVQQGRNLLDFLAKSVAPDNSPYSLLLKSELQLVHQQRDWYLLHEHLEEWNEPIYFHQFAERAAAKDLRYLGEVELRVMVPGNYPPEIETVLQKLSPDLIHMEQYMDFLRNRMFRQTLLCHRDVAPSYAVGPDRLAGLHVASSAKPASARPDICSDAVEQFVGRDGITLSSRQPLVKAAMLHLWEVWPQTVPFPTLQAAARARLNGQAPSPAGTVVEDAQDLGQCLLTFYTSAASLIELHAHPPRLVGTSSEHPLASPLARLQATMGNTVTNQRHELVVLGEFDRQVLRHIDGHRDRAALLDVLTDLVAQGLLKVQENGEAVGQGAQLRMLLGVALDEQLSNLARNALLIG